MEQHPEDVCAAMSTMSCKNADYVDPWEMRVVSHIPSTTGACTTRAMAAAQASLGLKPWDHADVGSIMAITIDESRIKKSEFRTKKLCYALVKVTKPLHRLAEEAVDGYGNMFAAGEEVIEAAPLGPFVDGPLSVQRFLESAVRSKSKVRDGMATSKAAQRLRFVDISSGRRLLVTKEHLWVAHVDMHEDMEQSREASYTSYGMMRQEVSERGGLVLDYTVVEDEDEQNNLLLAHILKPPNNADIRCCTCNTLGRGLDLGSEATILLCDSCFGGHCTECAKIDPKEVDAYQCPLCARECLPMHHECVKVRWGRRKVFSLSISEHKKILASRVEGA